LQAVVELAEVAVKIAVTEAVMVQSSKELELS
jgi:hypothetical protein